MGACLSCLGLRRRQSDSNALETSRLLHEDSFQPHYGGLDQHGPSRPPQLDPAELRREREAMERLCALTSDKLIDVVHSSAIDDGSKTLGDYPRLFNERFGGAESPITTISSNETAWLLGQAENEAPERAWHKVQHAERGRVTISFGDSMNTDEVRPVGNTGL